MNTEIFKTENLIEFHEELNDFAKHHQNKGGQEAHKLVESICDEIRAEPREGSVEGLKYALGFDDACKLILSKLYKRFVP